ncbi:formate-tetrahydrofolate ligase [Thecamonas trahens ATCC 50062]|uniref:formate--tetrahydrofolate ligase n=1 Tax=Thecamonas trahens ATCC 50062 TaxID=461836 RepID=A0A0L0DQV8_THETB|nr:formate-tetrahydrofolate ligase [Thecamonas trahens ATCC 50062]KNC54684.1 formate-tetrahydrofolate ligase [Thecamonas trahens ATCC 50062]|eukprot:XP_013761586.1 formate-tetrahydrofolate ligase [Thecamonas trahens ATCC 50062]
MAEKLGLVDDEYIPVGHYAGKVDAAAVLERLGPDAPQGKYVLITGINPTPLGEGKSTTAIGLSQALGAHLDRNVVCTARVPAMSTTFGIKGGAAGGGYAQIVPMDVFNLGLPDSHYASLATNLIAAQLDTRMYHESTQSDAALYRRLVPTVKGVRTFAPIMLKRLAKLGIDKTEPDELTPEEIRKFVRLDIDPHTISFMRVLDVNDRSLRKITINQSPTEKGRIREAEFAVTSASELCSAQVLCTSLGDLKEKIGNTVVAFSRSGDAVTVDDLGVTGAATLIMRDTVKPNLMQTIEGTPVLVSGSCFANISVGNSAVIADQVALKLVGNDGFVVTEAGFSEAIGAEKFFNIKCRVSGLQPSAVVLVATVRALKVHGGGPPVSPGRPLDDAYTSEALDLLEAGLTNLRDHIGNLTKYGVPVVVAINKFSTDTDAEVALVRDAAIAAGAVDAVCSEHHGKGGAGAVDLANAVIAATQEPSDFKHLYELDLPLKDKIEVIAREIYGADGVKYSTKATARLRDYERLGFGKLPVCIAKTQYAFSHRPADKGGKPSGYTFEISDVKSAIGAGFVVPIAGSVSLMPGLPTRPAIYDQDVYTGDDDTAGASNGMAIGDAIGLM